MSPSPDQRIRARAVIKALRPNQWTKNALVFAAFIFALGDKTQDVSLLSVWRVACAAGLFCMLSSSIYLVNDIRDVVQDRKHPQKKFRPIAAGQLPIPTAWFMSLVLVVCGLLGSFFLNTQFGLVALGYIILQIAYTFGLKRIALVDLFVIAAGFVLRALAGAVVLDVQISPWLLLCTLLLALFLALCKRRHERVILSDSMGETRTNLEKYDPKLLDQLIGIVSSAVIVFYALYTLWPDTIEKFGSSNLAFTIPFVLFGLFRYLDLVYRHEQGGRPEKILLTDLPLIIDMILYALTVFLALVFS